MGDDSKRILTTWQSLSAVMGSWRLLSVTLLAFSSGLPLGLVWTAIPLWLRREGIDIKVVGLVTLAQAPWSFKFLWSPLMDRYAPPILGRKRGWILVTQMALLGIGLWLAAVAHHPEDVGLIGALAFAMAFASASQDIAYDGYAVEVLRKEEHGLASGARNALGRAALLISGRVTITAAARLGWPVVHALVALCYLPMMLVTRLAPEPETSPAPPRSLRDAVWGPFVGLLGQQRAFEILGFVVLYKLADNLAQALMSPFLADMGYNDWDIGIAVGTVGLIGWIVGGFAGGILSERLGLGRALWLCGFLQMSAGLGYAVVAAVGVNRPVMYTAVAVEVVTSGMATGAFLVFLLRLTQKQFSATQYALLSSLFAIPRVFSGPVAGFMADAIGWRDFFIFTVFAGIPGLLLLHRFVPWGTKEPELHVAAPVRGAPLSQTGLLLRAALAGIVGWGLGAAATAGLGAARAYHAGRAFDASAALAALVAPGRPAEWVTFLAVLVFGLVTALATAATLAARRGMKDPAGA